MYATHAYDEEFNGRFSKHSQTHRELSLRRLRAVAAFIPWMSEAWHTKRCALIEATHHEKEMHLIETQNRIPTDIQSDG